MRYFYNQTVTSKPQNAGKTGFNEWGQMTYSPDKYNLLYLFSLGIDSTTEWDYDTFIQQIADLAELTADVTDGLITNAKFTLAKDEILTETLNVKLCRLSDKTIRNSLLVKWLNSNGGYQYDVFNARIDNGIQVSDKQSVLSVFADNQKEITTFAVTRKNVTVYMQQIPIDEFVHGFRVSNLDKWLDFKRMSQHHDVWIYSKRYIGDVTITDFSANIANCIKFNCNEHGLQTGDEIQVLGTTNYNRTTEIYRIDDNNFYVNYPYVSNQTGYFRRIVTATDWVRCQVDGIDEVINTSNNSFNIKFNLTLPRD